MWALAAPPPGRGPRHACSKTTTYSPAPRTEAHGRSRRAYLARLPRRAIFRMCVSPVSPAGCRLPPPKQHVDTDGDREQDSQRPLARDGRREAGTAGTAPQPLGLRLLLAGGELILPRLELLLQLLRQLQRGHRVWQRARGHARRGSGTRSRRSVLSAAPWTATALATAPTRPGRYGAQGGTARGGGGLHVLGCVLYTCMRVVYAYCV